MSNRAQSVAGVKREQRERTRIGVVCKGSTRQEDQIDPVHIHRTLIHGSRQCRAPGRPRAETMTSRRRRAASSLPSRATASRWRSGASA